MNSFCLVDKLKLLSKFFFYAFFAGLPFQIKTLIGTEDFYAGGFFNPYLSHFLYLGDVFLILCLFFLGLFFLFSKERLSKIFELDLKLFILVGIFLVTYIFSVFDSVDKWNSFMYGLRFFEFFVVFLLFSMKIFNPRVAIYALMGALVLCSMLGILQYILQNSVGLQVLGEPVISVSALGVAKISLIDKEVMRVYGTFPHPNVFGGYLAMALLFSVYFWNENKRLFTALIIIFGITLALTFSRGALLALISALVVYYSLIKVKMSWNYFIFGILFFVFLFFTLDLFSLLSQRLIFGDLNSIQERQLFFTAAKNMFFSGWEIVGAGNFTAEIQNYVSEKLMPWQFQPVHNIFILVLNEIGVFGFMIFVYIFGYLLKSFSDLFKSANIGMKKFLALLMAIQMIIFVVGMVDHYPISLYQGQALFWLFLAIGNAGLTRNKSFL